MAGFVSLLILHRGDVVVCVIHKRPEYIELRVRLG